MGMFGGQSHSRTPTPRQDERTNGQIEVGGENQQQVVQRSRWQAVLLEAGGIGAAVSEESMRRLKYCLQWLQVCPGFLFISFYSVSFISRTDDWFFFCYPYMNGSMRRNISMRKFLFLGISSRRFNSMLTSITGMPTIITIITILPHLQIHQPPPLPLPLQTHLTTHPPTPTTLTIPHLIKKLQIIYIH